MDSDNNVSFGESTILLGYVGNISQVAGPDLLIFLETWLPTRMSGLVSFGVKLYDPFLVAIKKIIGSYVIWGRMNRINDNLFETTLYNVWMREYKCW